MLLPITVIYLILAMLFGRAAWINDPGPKQSTGIYIVGGLLWLPYLLTVNITGRPYHGRDQSEE